MPKSRHKKKVDRRPAKRSGKNEGPADYRTARPVNEPPSRKCPYLDRVATLPNAFTPDECAQIINTAINDWDEKESQIQRDEGGKIAQNFVQDLDYRNTTLFIPKKPDDWLFQKIVQEIMNFNNSEAGYGFEVHGIAEPPNVMRYRAAELDPNGKPGKYDWHLDVGPGDVPSMRKISYSILLNPGEYEGGELAFRIGRSEAPHPGQNDPKAIGNFIVFPSYLMHCVLPVTKGTRYAVVGWVHGNSFR